MTFSEILEEKLKAAIKIKRNLMKFHKIKDHSEIIGFKCQVEGCGIMFSLPTALGGHMSKAHPNFKKQMQ